MTRFHDWPAIFEKASSEHSPERKEALYSALSELEKGLVAIGARSPGRERQARVPESFRQYILGLPSVPSEIGSIPRDTLFDILELAHRARNQSIHSGAPQSTGDTDVFVEVIYAAWNFLRQMFVSPERAAQVARTLLGARANWIDSDWPIDSPIVSEVFLFGSLGRGDASPQDIDLLAVDASGELVSLAMPYNRTATDLGNALHRSLLFLEEHQTIAASLPHAARCGWLDFVFIGEDFGISPDSTLRVVSAQRDPFFFLNLASDLRRFDPIAGEWSHTPGGPAAFSRLSEIRAELQKAGMVPRIANRTNAEPGNAFTLRLDDRDYRLLSALAHREWRPWSELPPAIPAGPSGPGVPIYTLRSRSEILREVIRRAFSDLRAQHDGKRNAQGNPRNATIRAEDG